MKKTVTIRLEENNHKVVKIESKKRGIGMSKLIEELLVKEFRECVYNVNEQLACSLEEKEIVSIIAFKDTIRKTLYNWVVKENRKNDLYVEEFVKYLEIKVRQLASFSHNEKLKKELKYWINKQILLIKAHNWDNIDFNRIRNERHQLYSLLRKAGVSGNKLSLVLKVINGKDIQKKVTTEEIIVG